MELQCNKIHVTFETPELGLCQMWFDFVKSQLTSNEQCHNGRNVNYIGSDEPYVENTHL